MGKKEKEHRKKISKRNESINMQKKNMEKVKDNFLKELIKKEQEAGKFNNNLQIPGINGHGPLI